MRKTLLIVICLAIAAFVGYRSVQAYRYHVPIQADEVQRIERVQSGTGDPEYRAIPASEVTTVVGWFNSASFQGDNDSLAGPGCGAVAMFIYLRSGERVGISFVGGRMEVSQNGRDYFLHHEQLEQYIRSGRTQGAGC